MNTLVKWSVIALAAVFLLGWASEFFGGRAEAKRWARERDVLIAVADDLADQSLELSGQRDSLRALVAEADSSANARARSAEERAREGRRVENAARASAQTAEDTLRLVLQRVVPEYLPTLDRYVHERDVIDAAKDDQIKSLLVLNESRLRQIADRDLLLDAQDSSLVVREAENAALRGALAAADNEIDALRKKAFPNPLAVLKRDWHKYAIGMAAGIVIDRFLIADDNTVVVAP
jgi:hypothetical protein